MKVIKLEISNFKDFINVLLNASGEVTTCPCSNCEECAKEDDSKIGFYINKLAEQKGWKPRRVAGWLDSIFETSPIAAFTILLRVIAIHLDQKYEDHIEKSEEIFIVSNLDGRIKKVYKAPIKNYRNFAAFRTLEDAKFACRIMRDHLKQMFNNVRK